MLQSIIIVLIFNLLFTPKANTDAVSHTAEEKFKLGNETLLDDNLDMIKYKRVALVTNNSGIMSDGTMLIDVLSKVQDVNVTKVFSPEHGFRGDDRDVDHIDEKTGIKVVTLYGNKRKPTRSDLTDVDVLVYDIQDVGARFYTYVNTMFYCMEAAYENNKEIVIADRPIIPDGNYVDGFLLDAGISSFVGMLDIPIAYGMTCGELAKLLNDEYFNGQVKLQVSKMKNYSRNMDYESLGLVWKNPSPNIYFPSSAVSYLGTCLFEGTNFAEGRGTDKPFEYVGAPWCDGEKLKSAMDAYNFEGVEFVAISFTPTTIISPSNPPKFVGTPCQGVYVKVTDKTKFEPVKVGIALLISLKKLFPQFSFHKNNFIDKLSGTTSLRTMVNNGSSLEQIISTYRSDLSEFKKIREGYLMY